MGISQVPNRQASLVHLRLGYDGAVATTSQSRLRCWGSWRPPQSRWSASCGPPWAAATSRRSTSLLVRCSIHPLPRRTKVLGAPAKQPTGSANPWCYALHVVALRQLSSSFAVCRSLAETVSSLHECSTAGSLSMHFRDLQEATLYGPDSGG